MGNNDCNICNAVGAHGCSYGGVVGVQMGVQTGVQMGVHGCLWAFRWVYMGAMWVVSAWFRP